MRRTPRHSRKASIILRRLNSAAPKLLEPNFGVAIALLLHRVVAGAPAGPSRVLHRPDSGDPLSTTDLQLEVCDPTWAKDTAFLPAGAEGAIYKPFTEHFKGRSPGVNNWRNSFDLQGGLGCDAPYTGRYLRSAAYLAEPRFDCRFRDPTTGRCNSPDGNTAANRICFNPNKRGVPPGPDTGAKHRPKLLTRGQDVDRRLGYWYVEPTVDVLADLLGDPTKRVPVYPFAAALYGGSPYFETWGTEVSRERLESDLALGPAEFLALFDTDPASPLNADMLRLARGVGVTAGGVTAAAAEQPPAAATGTIISKAGLSDPIPYKERGAHELVARAGKEADPVRRWRLLERANQGHRRTLRSLAEELEAAGYTIDEQLDGYDLCGARSENTAHLFEIKTWTATNLAAQVRAGWAQLFEYRYRNRHRLPDDVRMYLVLDREPPGEYWAWSWLADELDVISCWIKAGTLATLPEYEDRLPPR